MTGWPAPATYDDACGIARALDVIGERWALLIVRELVLGPKRFTDLQAGLRRVSPDVLSQRLRELEAAGVIERRTLPRPAASRVYELTARGRALEPALHALGRFGSREPMPGDDPVLGVDAAMVALPSLFDAGRAGDLDATYELALDGDEFVAGVAGGRLTLARGRAPDCRCRDRDRPGHARPDPLARPPAARRDRGGRGERRGRPPRTRSLPAALPAPGRLKMTGGVAHPCAPSMNTPARDP